MNTSDFEANNGQLPSYQNYDTKGYFTFSDYATKHWYDDTYHNPPYNATFEKFITPVPDKKWPKFVDGKWTFVDNYKDTTYWDAATHEKVTISDYEVVPPADAYYTDPGPSLAQVQKDKKTELFNIAFSKKKLPIEITTEAAVVATFTTTPAYVSEMSHAIVAYEFSGMPDEFYWKDVSGARIPFTLNDLKTLFSTIVNRNFKLQKKFDDYADLIDDTQLIADVQAITWED